MSSTLPWFRFFPSDWLAGTRGLTAGQTGIYITLIATMYDHGHPIDEDHSRLARLCGAGSVKAFAAALTVLVEAGKITRTKAGLWNDRVAQESEARLKKSFEGRVSANARWRGKAKQKQHQKNANASIPHSVRNANQNPESDLFKDSGESSKRERAPANGHARSDPFETFWQIYPHKVGKAAAITAFAKATKIAPVPTIMAGLSRYVAKTDDRPWCNPTTFLNQQRWDDQPAPAPSQRATGPPQPCFDENDDEEDDNPLAAYARKVATGKIIP